MKKDKLKSLEEHRKEVLFERKWEWWKKSGVECPECKSELMKFIMYPGEEKQLFRCPECNYETKI